MIIFQTGLIFIHSVHSIKLAINLICDPSCRLLAADYWQRVFTCVCGDPSLWNAKECLDILPLWSSVCIKSESNQKPTIVAPRKWWFLLLFPWSAESKHHWWWYCITASTNSWEAIEPYNCIVAERAGEGGTTIPSLSLINDKLHVQHLRQFNFLVLHLLARRHFSDILLLADHPLASRLRLLRVQ